MQPTKVGQSKAVRAAHADRGRIKVSCLGLRIQLRRSLAPRIVVVERNYNQISPCGLRLGEQAGLNRPLAATGDVGRKPLSATLGKPLFCKYAIMRRRSRLTSAEDFVYSKLGTVIAIALAIFPFAAVLAKLAETEGATTVIVVAAIFVIFFATLLVATRITLEPDTEAARAPRTPAPPIAWSWDGVNRQPDSDNSEEQVEAHH